MGPFEVPVEVRLDLVAKRAQSALVGPLAGMRPDMALQVVRPARLVLTVRALKAKLFLDRNRGHLARLWR